MLIGTIVVLLAVAGGAAWYLWLRPKPGTTPAGRSTVPGPAATGAAPTSAPTAVEPSAEATTATTASATPIPPVSPTGTPTPAPDLGSTPRSLEDARAALQRGAISEAGRGFAAALAKSPGGRATVQLLVACADETVAKAIQATPGDELFVVPVTLKGRACHRLCWGLYESSARADSAMASIPPYFREGGAKPKAITLREILH